MCEDINFSSTAAIRDGNLKRVRELLDYFGFSNCESEGYDLLVEAILNGRTEIAKLFLMFGCKVNNKNRKKHNYNTPLVLAITNGYAEIVEMLLHRGADIHVINTCGSTVLHTAVQQGNRKIIKLLLDHGADVHVVNNNGVNSLHLASTKQYIQIAEDLLNHGANINSVCTSTSRLRYTSLHISSEQGNEEAVRLFLSKGADINATTSDNLTPLHIAVKAEHETVVKLLLEHGAKVDAQDKIGNTVLHLAVELGNSKIVEDILKYRPDINNQSNRNSFKTAVRGSRESYKEIVESLLRYGFIVHREDVDNPELLRNAVEKGYLKIVEDLLKNGADANMLDNSIPVSGGTLLHSAAINKQDEVAKLLIDYGANVNAKNERGKTPVFYAVQNNDVKITRLLLSNGAVIKDTPDLLRSAAENGYLEIVEDLLKNGADANILDNSISASGGTFLHSAAINKQDAVAKLLIDYGANVNAKNGRGKTPVFYAVQNSDVKITRLLLTNGADVKDSSELLHSAAAHRCLEIVEDLLKYGTDVNTFDHSEYGSGGTPLHRQVILHQEEVAKLLINYGANVNAKDRKGRTPVFYAVQNNDVKITRLLLTNGADIKDDAELLHTAAASGHLEIVEDLLKHGADINISVLDHSEYGKGDTPLHSAVLNKQDEVAKLLVDFGANVNAKNEKGKTPVFYAVENSDVKITKLLLTNGADIKSSRRLLHIAASNGYLEIVDDLLKRGAQVNVSDHSTYGSGGTPLHSAVRKNRKEVAKLLVKYGANVNAKDEMGKTPVFYAVANSDARITSLLVTNGADIRDNSELMHSAAVNGCLKIVEELLMYDADVNISDQSTNGSGGTPLHSAVRKNRGKVAKLLVYYGANVNAKDGRGKTPLYYAVENNDVKITRLLLTNGVDIEGGPELLYVAIENKCKEIVDILLKHGANVNVIIRDCTPLAFAMSDYNFLSDEDYDDYDYDDDNDNFAEEYKFRRTRASTEIVELLKKHVVKLQVAGLYVHERNLQLIIDDPEIINFQRECKREIAIMKREKISNSCVSFYYILTKNRNQLATYTNNENVVLAIRLVDHKIKFPIYASMIERKFREGRERIKLMELGKQIFYSLFENLSELPLLCIEKIFSYLSNYDLKLLIRK